MSTLNRAIESAKAPGSDVKTFVEVDCYDPRHYEKQIVVHSQEVEFRFNFERTSDAADQLADRPRCGLFVDEMATDHTICYRYPRNQRFCFLKESPIKPFYRQSSLLEKRYDLVFTFDRELLERGAPFTLLYYGTSWLSEFDRTTPPPIKTKLLSFVGSIEHDNQHGYELRRTVANRLLQDPRADCFGKGILPIESKRTGLESYCFSVAMENIKKDYYFTEKLIDCFLLETAPIYWGCSSIGTIFDPRGMLCFDTVDELMSRIDSLDRDAYERMRPFVRKNKDLVYDLKLQSNAGMCSRMADQLATRLYDLKPVSAWRRTKLTAGWRLLSETAGNMPSAWSSRSRVGGGH